MPCCMCSALNSSARGRFTPQAQREGSRRAASLLSSSSSSRLHANPHPQPWEQPAARQLSACVRLLAGRPPPPGAGLGEPPRAALLWRELEPRLPATQARAHAGPPPGHAPAGCAAARCPPPRPLGSCPRPGCSLRRSCRAGRGGPKPLGRAEPRQGSHGLHDVRAMAGAAPGTAVWPGDGG